MLKKETKAVFGLFGIAVVLRSLPELLISRYPVGYETITYYLPSIYLTSLDSTSSLLGLTAHLQFMSAHPPLMDTFRAGPFFYVLMWVFQALTGDNGFLLLKVVAPILYGCLIASFFIFLRRGVNLDYKVAFLAAMLLIFQPAALRESWDRFRTVLALTFLFMTLTASTSSRFKWPKVVAFGILTVLSRDYVGVILIVAIAGRAILEKKDRLASVLALLPSLAILFALFNPVWLEWNMLSAENPFAVTGYAWVVLDVFSIFLFCFLPLLPFVVKGFWRNTLLDPIVGFLALASFWIIFLPWFSIPGYQRWLMLLVFPFCIYTAVGLQRLHLGKNKTRAVVAFVLAFVVIGVGYATGTYSYIGIVSNSYVPTGLTQSSIAWSQVDDVKIALTWLVNNGRENGTLLVEERFYGWSLIFLEPLKHDVKIEVYGANRSFEPQLQNAIREGSGEIYLIWYSGTSPQNFLAVHSQGDICIFEYSV